MSIISRRFLLASVLLVAVCLGSVFSIAQQRAVNPVGRVDITSELKETPEFDVRNIQTNRGSKKWFEISVTYETDPDWVDELEFVYYIFMDTNFDDNRQMLLSHTVTYVDIERGRHQSTVYMHPNTYERYVDRVQFIGVEIRYKGRPVRWTSDKSNMRDSQWWENARQQFPPVTGKMLDRSDTPFALVNPNDYELEKQVSP